VTSLSAEAGRCVTVADALPVMEGHLAAALGHSTWRRIDGAAELAGGPQPVAALAGR
jgi:lipoyl(octanoyl) transferase